MRTPSGAARQRFRQRSSSRPSRSLGSSWSSVLQTGMFGVRRCWVTMHMVRTPGCAIGSTRPGVNTCCRSANTKVFEQGTSFAVPARTKKDGRGPWRPRPDRNAKPIGELIVDSRPTRRPSRSATDQTDLPSAPGSSSRAFTRLTNGAKMQRQGWREGAEVPPREEWLIAEWPEGERAERLLDLEPARRHRTRTTHPAGADALEDRARLQTAQRRTRPGPLRRPLLARVVSPHRAGHRRPRLPHTRAAEPFSPAAGLTLPKAVLLIQPIFKCWTGRCQTCRRPVNLDRLALTLGPPRRVTPNKALLNAPDGTPFVRQPCVTNAEEEVM